MPNARKLRRYHSAVWDEPVILEMGYPGRRGLVFSETDRAVVDEVGAVEDLIPKNCQRRSRLELAEMSEHEVLRHYLHLSQEALGMVGISLFGTCTMKYNPRVNEAVALRELADLHPLQDGETLQGILSIIYGFDLMLRELSGMDRFVFQAGGGADAAYMHACVTRAYHAARGELGQRDEIVTTIQSHPCNAATAASAGFKVITLMLDEKGYPSLDALKAAVSNRTAALMINNPDDMGIYNPEIKEWVRLVHAAGGLCFYDHANFNGVMGKIRAGELGFDACMYMLHKTFGAPKGGGPAVGAYGCTETLEKFLPTPVVTLDGAKYRLDHDRPHSIGKVREFWGNVPQVMKAYSWTLAMGAEGIDEASDISVLVSNYMAAQLLEIRGITKSHPNIDGPRMEMTRFSAQTLREETGVGVFDIQNRMVDFGIDLFWLSHHPLLVEEPFTPEAGETWSKEEVDYWIAVLVQIADEAYSNPELVKKAPHNQASYQARTEWVDDPARWATTWRAFKRKHRERVARAKL